MGWFNKKPEAAKSSSSSSTPLDRVNAFLVKYDGLGSKRTSYAMALWGIHEAFLKIFGGLDDFHRAEKSKQQRYLLMIGNHGIEAETEGKASQADCNMAFLNFLVATQGVARSNLRGSIEHVADRIDGIVEFGAREIDRVGKIESDAKEFLASEAMFQIGSGTVRGAVTERNVVVASQLIINDLQKILVTHQDYHLYIIEHYARLSLEPGIRTLLDTVSLFDIEFDALGQGWTKDSQPGPGVAYIESIRPAIRKWCQVTVPSLDPGELSLRVIGAAYGHFRHTGESHFNEIRAGYAKLFRDQLLQDRRTAAAADWNRVVKALER